VKGPTPVQNAGVFHEILIDAFQCIPWFYIMHKFMLTNSLK